MSENVLAVDPGKVTGVAMMRDGGFTSFQLEGWWGTIETLREEARSCDVVVVESFVVRANTHKLDSGSFAHTTDLIGACRFVAADLDMGFVKQTPGEAKSFASDDKLKALGWHNPTKGGHANDAARHLLTYLVKNRDIRVLTALAGEEV